MIRKYYLEGYGYPKKYYTDVDLDKFVVKGMITQQQSDELKAEKGSDKKWTRSPNGDSLPIGNTKWETPTKSRNSTSG